MKNRIARMFGRLASLLLVFLATESRAEPGAGFRFQPVNESSLTLFEGAKPVLVYNFGSITNAAALSAQSHSCYLHPIYGLDGEILTGDFPKDHVYHRGLYWAWPHIRIAEKEYDLWSLRGIRPQFERWIERETTADSAVLGVENGWFVDGRKVMREQVHLRAHRVEGDGRAIDLELSWTPLDETVTLWGAPGKSYGGVTFRFGQRSKTIVTVPRGRTSEDLLMTKLPWADLSGDFASNRLSGASVFVDPGHPAFPPEWMTREYGMLAVGYPGVKPATFAPGKIFTCRYRIWVHRGNPEAAEIQRAYEAFSREARNTPN